MFGCGESYLSAFAEFLKATPFQLGVLTSVPQLIASLVQLFSSRIAARIQSRQRFVVIFCGLQASVWLLIIAAGYFTRSINLLIILASCYFAFGALPMPAWVSWMGDLVPEKIRGLYFGKRNRFIGFTTSLSVLTGGILLQEISRFDTLLAFSVLFTIAFIGRMISTLILAWKYEPAVELKPSPESRLPQFLKTLTTSDFGIFCLFTMAMHLGAFIAVPTFVIYWLRHLEFSYLQYTIVLSAAHISGFLTMAIWGRQADHFGNRKILEVSATVLSMLPLVWYALIFLPVMYRFPGAVVTQVLAGMNWAGFNLSSGNYLYDAVKREQRLSFSSYYNILKGCAIFVGGIIGGWICGWNLHPGISDKLLPHALFIALILSSVLRLLAVLHFIPKIRELRSDVRYKASFRILAAIPQGVLLDGIVGVNRTMTTFRRRLKKIWVIVERKYDL